MSFERISFNVDSKHVTFEYAAYSGFCVSVNSSYSGWSGSRPNYHFDEINKTTSKEWLELATKIINSHDLSTNQRWIITNCIEQLVKNINRETLSVEIIWK